MVTRLMLELGCNHQGEVDIARRMVDDAKRLGAYAVKIQMRCVEEIPEEMKGLKRDPSKSFGETYYDHRKALELKDEDIARLKEHAEAQGLVFATSVFDVESMRRAVEDLHIMYVKLPSQYFLKFTMNVPLATYRREYGLFTIRSTGMHTTREVLDDLDTFQFDVTMYCRSIYPHGAQQADLGSARMIYEGLGSRCKGYSSHDKDGEMIPWFVLLGAQWVERHYTIDKGMKGSDHHTVSSDFKDMMRLIQQIEETEEFMACKNFDGLVSPEEIANRKFYVEVAMT